jgi:hypothetical protein
MPFLVPSPFPVFFFSFASLLLLLLQAQTDHWPAQNPGPRSSQNPGPRSSLVSRTIPGAASTRHPSRVRVFWRKRQNKIKWSTYTLYPACRLPPALLYCIPQCHTLLRTVHMLPRCAVPSTCRSIPMCYGDGTWWGHQHHSRRAVALQ